MTEGQTISFDSTFFLFYGFEGMFYILLFIYTISVVIYAYHWFTYGTDSRMNMISLAVYLLGGAILFITFGTALALL